MRRREFIAGFGGAVAWPVVARAQQAALPVVGVLNRGTFNETRRALNEAFQNGLAETGFVEGRNLQIEYHWAENRDDRLRALAADLVRRQVAVIVTLGGATVAAYARAATQSIPVVFQAGVDPVQVGLVTSLARPGGNVTGVTMIQREMAAKRVELLHQLVPAVTSIAYLFNPTAIYGEAKEVKNAGPVLGLRVSMMGAARQSDIEPAFAEMARQGAGALIVSTNPLFLDYADQVAALAVRNGIPAAFPLREAVKAGGLMSYGPSQAAVVRQIGIYAGRILKGEKPVDLPVMQPTKFELVINLKTAKPLALTIPPNLLALTDEVIE
jgi:putative tryptophan/tyrosine transport system substrate-binding protein